MDKNSKHLGKPGSLEGNPANQTSQFAAGMDENTRKASENEDLLKESEKEQPLKEDFEPFNLDAKEDRNKDKNK